MVPPQGGGLVGGHGGPPDRSYQNKFFQITFRSDPI